MSYEQDARRELIDRLRAVYSSGSGASGGRAPKRCPPKTRRRCIPKRGLKAVDEFIDERGLYVPTTKRQIEQEKRRRRGRKKPAKKKKTAKKKKVVKKKAVTERRLIVYRPPAKKKKKPKKQSEWNKFYTEWAAQHRGEKNIMRRAGAAWQQYKRAQGSGITGGRYNANQYGRYYEHPERGGVMIDSDYGYPSDQYQAHLNMQGNGGVLVDSTFGGVLVDSFYTH